MSNFGFKMNVKLILTNFINYFRPILRFSIVFTLVRNVPYKYFLFIGMLILCVNMFLVNQHLHGKNIVCEIIVLIN